MRLWLMTRIKPDYCDATNGFVIRAETEQEARVIADSSAAGGDWLEPGFARVDEIFAEGQAGVVLENSSAC